MFFLLAFVILPCLSKVAIFYLEIMLLNIISIFIVFKPKRKKNPGKWKLYLWNFLQLAHTSQYAIFFGFGRLYVSVFFFFLFVIKIQHWGGNFWKMNRYAKLWPTLCMQCIATIVRSRIYIYVFFYSNWNETTLK